MPEMDYPPFTVLAEDLAFPEGPMLLPDGSVVVTEIAAGCLTLVSPTGARRTLATTGGGPNGAALGPDGAIYVCNNGGSEFLREPGHIRVLGQGADYSGGRIERVEIASGKVERLYDQCDGFALKGPNDLVFDRHGGFYFSDLGRTRARERDRGGVYYALADGSAIREVIYPLSMPNGVGLSPDGRVLYVAETETGRLWQWRITAPGEVEKLPYPSLTTGTLVFNAPNAQRFDSLAVQADGRICVATLGDGGISVIDASSGTMDFVPLPDRHTTNICFGGAGLREAYVTLSSTGRLVRLDWPAPGLPLAY